MKLIKYLFLVVLLTTIFSIQIFSQKKDPPVDVKVNVLVTDEKGQPIDDVKQENIKIFEDGVEQKITSFTRKEPVLNLGLIVDNTGSMRLHLEQLIWAGKMISLNLLGKDNVFIVRFISADKIQVLQDWVSPQGSQQNQARVQTVLDNLFIEGGLSAVIDAVHFSAKKMIRQKNQNNHERYALILLSDAEDRASSHKETELIELLTRNEIEFYSIAFVGQVDIGQIPKGNSLKRIKKFLNNLSNETGGTSLFLESENPSQDSISQALNKLINELRSQYIIGYTSTNQKRNDKQRKLTVQIADHEKGEKRTGIIREGFTVPKK